MTCFFSSVDYIMRESAEDMWPVAISVLFGMNQNPQPDFMFLFSGANRKSDPNHGTEWVDWCSGKAVDSYSGVRRFESLQGIVTFCIGQGNCWYSVL
jgi:hypothetical protein